MPNGIIRLQGGARSLIWPGRKLAPLLAALARLQGQPSPEGEARAATISARAAELFAETNNLRIRRVASWPWRTLGELPSWWRAHSAVLGHAQLFAPYGGGRVVLAVVHTSRTFQLEIAPDNWTVDRLPVSWHRTPGLTAYALRAAVAAPALTGSTQGPENDDV